MQGNEKEAPITVLLTPVLRDHLRTAAREQDRSVSSYTRELVRRDMAERQAAAIK